MTFQKFPTLVYVILMGLFYSSEAFTFYVGGNDGWVINPTQNYNQWASENRFNVDDSLVFKYKKGSDSVLVVSKEDYDKCNTKNPIKTLDDGNSIFKFERSGPFYFISGIEGNCEKGEKLIVVVLAIRNPIKTPPSSSSPISQPPTVPSPIAQPPKEAQTPNSSPPIAQPPKTQTPNSPPSPSPIGTNPPKSSSSSPSPSPTPVAPKVSPSPATTPTTTPTTVPTTAPATTPATTPSPLASTPTSEPPSETTITPSTAPSGTVASSPADQNNSTSDITAPPPVRSSSSALVSYSSVGFVLVSLVLGNF